ncbi:MAG: hypothetical protein CMJ11_01835 [Pelagibacterales bacterium]|nr:hypothetical protein [Pelagibacterales bacterium]|tara:strand:- start:2297 stop:4333 length:2037 start_codon:yes stop_codon:yes gene_type:complete
MNSLNFYPLININFLIALMVLSLIVIFIGFKLKAPGNIFRAMLLCLIILSISNPTIISENRENIPDTVAVVLDLSPSQDINNRKDIAQKTYNNIKNELEKINNLDVRLKTINGERGSKIFEPLNSMIGDVPAERLAGAIIITDGQISDAPTLLDNFNFKSPINILLTGNKEEKDRRLIIESSPRFGIVGEEINIDIKVEDISASSPNALVSINMNDEIEQSRSIPIGEIVTITMPLERAGITSLNIEVEAGKEELTLQNNKALVEINAIRERLKVMLVSGEPNMGLRSWRNLLNSDPSVDLIHFTILRPPNKQDITPVGELSLIPFPSRELFQANLNDFDLIIFDQYHLRGILPQFYLKNVVEYVVNGGALLDASGPSYAGPYSLSLSPLQNILPTEPTGDVVLQEFIPIMTNYGERHPVTANLKDNISNNWGPWYRMVEGITIAGDVLLEGPEARPLLVLNRVGQGRVAQILSDQSWVWTKPGSNKGPQADLLRRLVHWLMKEPELEENELSARIDNNTILITKNSLILDNKPIISISPDNTKKEIILEDIGKGKQIGKILSPQEGTWKFSSGNSKIRLIVGNSNASEYLDVRTTDNIVEPIVEFTSGSINWVNNENLPKIRHLPKSKLVENNDHIKLVKNEKYFVKSLQQSTLTPWYLILVLSLFLLFLAWYRETK